MTFHRWLFSLLSGRTLRAHLFFCLFTDTVVAPSQALGLGFFSHVNGRRKHSLEVLVLEIVNGGIAGVLISHYQVTENLDADV